MPENALLAVTSGVFMGAGAVFLPLFPVGLVVGAIGLTNQWSQEKDIKQRRLLERQIDPNQGDETRKKLEFF